LARLGAELGKGPEASAPQFSEQCRNSGSAALIDIEWNIGCKTMGCCWRGEGGTASQMVAELIVSDRRGYLVVFLRAARWLHGGMAIRGVA
jgi:hypothetical protein